MKPLLSLLALLAIVTGTSALVQLPISRSTDAEFRADAPPVRDDYLLTVEAAIGNPRKSTRSDSAVS